MNPGPWQPCLTFFHWNLNDSFSWLCQNFISTRVYHRTNIDIIFLFEIFLNYSITKENDWLKIEGYIVIRSDHPNGFKKEVFVYTIKSIFLLSERTMFLPWRFFLVTEILLENEKCFLTCLYRLPNQSHREFENFCTNLYFLIDNINNELPIFSVITADFNSRCSKLCNKNIINSVWHKINCLNHQKDTNNLLTNHFILETIPFLSSILFFVTTRI